MGMNDVRDELELNSQINKNIEGALAVAKMGLSYLNDGRIGWAYQSLTSIVGLLEKELKDRNEE